MKGKLIKIEERWMVGTVCYADLWSNYIPLHPDDVKQIERDSQVFDNIEARIAAYPNVEFDMVSDTYEKLGKGNTYAKLIPSKEPSYELEYNRYMKTFVNSNLNPPTIEQFVDKVNTDSDFAKYWGPGGKEQQKQLITEIMDLDAKDGLYDTVNELDKLAEETFKGDDATTFVQREIWKDGYRKAQETLYTEEQVREAMYMARKLSGVAYTNDEIIQSLKQPKKD